MDFFDWQARKQGINRNPRKPRKYEAVDLEAPRQSQPIEVRELTASTTVVRRLRRLWTDKRG